METLDLTSFENAINSLNSIVVRFEREKDIDFIKETLKRHIQNHEAKFYIFGSRANGKYSQYSDVDIAIDCPDMTFDKKLRLESDFENSTFPYEVDIVDLNDIKDNFKNLIKNSLKELEINAD